MTITPFAAADISAFLALAAQENWVVGAWEFEFLIARFPQGCFTAHDDSGAAAGFVTSLRHNQSGWIGNLIVAERLRGSGIGTALFNRAHVALTKAGANTIWLTASTAGAPLYEKHGFRALDTITRWIGTGRQRHVPHTADRIKTELSGSMQELDAAAWGDDRSALLTATMQRGILEQNPSGFITQQAAEGDIQFGPFAARDSGSAERLFDAAAGTVPKGTRILIDAPAANRSAIRLFTRRNMERAGSNLLMYAGKKPAYRPELIYGLATMGSCG
ncbi:MAG TPA: GNAT family N-acetyltransferase [Desulfuromonadales bacterium]|nr:GNAT family N-acetyltransferase [Desulfuromonadales bacterium]